MLAEGQARELIRNIQEWRKKTGLTPADLITLKIEADPVGLELVKTFETEIKKAVNANNLNIEVGDNGELVKVGEMSFYLTLVN